MASHGTSFIDAFAGAPSAIDKILRGTKPAERPFERVTRREFLTNLKTARDLGLTIAVDLQKSADRVIAQLIAKGNSCDGKSDFTIAHVKRLSLQPPDPLASGKRGPRFG